MRAAHNVARVSCLAALLAASSYPVARGSIEVPRRAAPPKPPVKGRTGGTSSKSGQDSGVGEGGYGWENLGEDAGCIAGRPACCASGTGGDAAAAPAQRCTEQIRGVAEVVAGSSRGGGGGVGVATRSSAQVGGGPFSRYFF